MVGKKIFKNKHEEVVHSEQPLFFLCNPQALDAGIEIFIVLCLMDLIMLILHAKLRFLFHLL